MTPLVIIGCGGFGREVWSTAQAINTVAPRFEILGMLDDNLSAENSAALHRIGATHLGGIEWFGSAADDVHGVIAIGSSTQGSRSAAGRLWCTPTRRSAPT